MELELQEFFTQIILDVVLALVALALAYGLSAIKSSIAKAKVEALKITNEKERQLLIDALDDIDILTTKTVSRIEQTTAKSLRELVKDGKIERNELIGLSQDAFNEISKSLRPECKTLVEKHFGDFSKYLTNSIEEKVLELKSSSS